ncbi:hypothetical protein BASA81_008405 [Batrachochytrium salamandrivorans]|nr:hypothetical protein BASA81_008405 [Batrachochytrium salamandrivorans]
MSLPALLPSPATHPRLDGAASRIDASTKQPYLIIENLDEGKLRVVKINRKKAKNGFDSNLYLCISDALNQAAKDDSVLVVILTGEGEYFSSGADLRAEMAGDVEGLKFGKGSAYDPVGVFMRTFLRFPKPLIAAVNGPAMGVGCTMLPHCDIVYASETASFLVPFSRIAVVPEFCSSVTFPKLLGTSTANEMLLFGKPLGAQRACELGLVSQVFKQDKFLDQVVAEVRKGLVFPLLDRTLPLFKNMLKKWDQDHLEQICLYELEMLDQRAENGDTAEAIIAFMSQGKSKM